MSKRANGEGSIYKRADGRWCATVSLDLGRRKSFYGPTREAVARKLTAALKARQDGLPLPAERQTVDQFLAGWLESVKPSLRPRTHRTYSDLLRLHCLPTLGRISLAKLTPEHLQHLYAERLGAGLKPQSVRHVHAVLHKALRDALRLGLIVRNPADLVSPPRASHVEMRTLNPEEVRRLLDAANEDRLEALYVLALTTGMRQGEILASRWRHLDFEARTIQVRGTLQRAEGGLVIMEPKTAGSRRLVALTRDALAALRTHRVAQATGRLAAGAAWEDHDLIFANEVGRPIEAGNLIRRSFLPLLTRANLPRIRFHDLRHTAATLMLGQNVHPKVVAEMLGHSRVGVTLDLYSHVTPTMQRQATDALEAVLRA